MILTGLSGSGKSTVLKTFEDLGYYCVDNLPVELIPTFSELHVHGECGNRARGPAGGRARGRAARATAGASTSKFAREDPATLVFIEATEEALLRRFSETRRPHPLGHDRPVREGLRRERELMAPIRKLADVVIDTTEVQRPRVAAVHHPPLPEAATKRPMMVSLVSFGYRYGVPADADLVFDVRFLPNPHFIPQAAQILGTRPARSGATSARFRRPENSCGASRACSPI